MNSISTLVFSLSFIWVGEMLHMHGGVRFHQNRGKKKKKTGGNSFLVFNFLPKRKDTHFVLL